jgi:hypothetical protein
VAAPTTEAPPPTSQAPATTSQAPVSESPVTPTEQAPVSPTESGNTVDDRIRERLGDRGAGNAQNSDQNAGGGDPSGTASPTGTP